MINVKTQTLCDPGNILRSVVMGTGDKTEIL